MEDGWSAQAVSSQCIDAAKLGGLSPSMVVLLVRKKNLKQSNNILTCKMTSGFLLQDAITGHLTPAGCQKLPSRTNKQDEEGLIKTRPWERHRGGGPASPIEQMNVLRCFPQYRFALREWYRYGNTRLVPVPEGTKYTRGTIDVSRYTCIDIAIRTSTRVHVYVLEYYLGTYVHVYTLLQYCNAAIYRHCNVAK